jgi:hypothetical protein
MIGERKIKKTVTGIMLTLLLIGILLLTFDIQPINADQVFSDDFDDGDISDWTVTATGDATIDVSTDTCASLPYSVHMKSLGNYKAMGVSPTYTLNIAKNYTVSFYFLIPHTDNHWFEVFNNHQIYLVIDSNDDLKCYNGTTSYMISELTTNQWYPIEIKAHPSSNSYDVYANVAFKRTCSMWIHGGWENSFRIGDRADGSTDKGEAYWDDIYISQDITPCGGIYVPVNKLELLDPYIGLTILLAAAAVTLVYIKKRKRRTEINS